MNNPFNKSLIYDQLKILAVLLVIAGHCFAMYSPGGAIAVMKGSLFFELCTLIVYRFHVPCFFMVSGAIFALCLKRNVYPNGRIFVQKKSFRLLLPYMIFGIFVVPPVMILCGLLDPAKAYTFLWNFITGSEVRHLWYLYCLFLVFLLAWSLRRFLVAENVRKVLVISFLVSLIFRSFSPEFFRYFQVANTFYYQFFFVCGIYLDYYFDEILSFIKAKQKYLWICFFVLLCSAFADLWTLSGYVYALCGMVLTLWFAVWISEKTAIVENPFIVMLGKDSYGIYLFHAMIVYVIFLLFSSVSVPAIFLVSVAFIGSLILSLALTELFRKFRLGFVMGEGKKRRDRY